VLEIDDRALLLAWPLPSAAPSSSGSRRRCRRQIAKISVDTEHARYDRQQAAAFFERALDEIRRIRACGHRGAAWSSGSC
jgi:hypothetical protein